MVASTGITIENIYLDGRERSILSGGVSSLEDDTDVHISENRTTSTNARSHRIRFKWQLSWSTASEFITNLFEIVRNERGFIFISPIDSERVVTAAPLKNTVTGLYTGDGVTTTFQLQRQKSLTKDIGGGSITSDAFDINYPLASTVTVYVNGVSASISGFSQTTGIVTMSAAPANGAAMTATFQHGWAAMFSSQTISRTLLQSDQTEVRSAQIEEIF
jgi:uncharacterized protein (TIGR02217 family)